MIYKTKKIIAVMCMLLILTCMVTPDMVFADDTAKIIIRGIELNDQVAVYRIAEQADGGYGWVSRVQDWIKNNDEGKEYDKLKPAQLEKMTQDRALEFCQKFLISCKDDSQGIDSLQGYSITAEEEKDGYEVSGVDPGYYIVLAKGTNRIYELKWIRVDSSQTAEVIYDAAAGDYWLPSIETSVKNVSDETRNHVVEGDELEIGAAVSIPQYPNMYATGKRILNLTVIVPNGLEYQQDSIALESDGELEFSQGEYKECSIYRDADDNILYFKNDQGYYYEPSGEILLSLGDEKEALDAYNKKHEKKLTADDMTVEKGLRVFVFSIDTEKELSQVTLHYKVVKDNATNEKGMIDSNIILSYSTSPLDANAVCNSISAATVNTYGIYIAVCEGTGESAGMTAEEKYEKAKRLTGAEFAVYKLSNTYDGNYIEEKNLKETSRNMAGINPMENAGSTENETESETVNQTEYVYDDKTDKTYEYTYMIKIVADKTGVASVGGLEPTGYLVIQTLNPTGHTLSETNLVISPDTWTNDTDMEGRCSFRVLWMEYKTRYLPGTGSAKAAMDKIIGLAVIIFGIGICAGYYRKEILNKIIIIGIKIHNYIKTVTHL